MQPGMKPVERPPVSEAPSRHIHGIERVMLRFGETMGADLVIGRVEGPVDAAAFRAAATQVVRRHPPLRVRVEGCPPERFVYQDAEGAPVAVEVIVTPGDSSGDGAWQAAAVRETTRPFALTGEPACRFLLVIGPGPEPRLAHAIISAPHALVDGRCLLRLLDDLLTAWAAAAQGTRAVLPELPITPAAATLVRRPLVYRAAAPLLRRVWISDLRAWQARPSLTPRAAAVRDQDVATLAAFREGTPAGWLRLQSACKRHQVTVGGALLAATWFALRA